MKRKKFLPIAAILVVIGIALVAATVVSDHTAGERALTAVTPTAALIQRGAYLAKMGDCAACHTASGRPPFTGGLAMRIPIGTIYSTNITFDSTDGIGSYSLADFDRAVRFGVSHGHTLYPAMPFPSYANLVPEDIQALYIFFKYGVSPSRTPNVENKVPFPLSLRFPLTMWRWAFAPQPKPFEPRHGMDPEVAGGAYFVEGLGHCGECHTPRGMGMQVKAQTAADGSTFLTGARVDNWYAPSLRSKGGQGGLSDWTVADLSEFLSNGTNHHGIAFGSMSEVIEHSTQYMTEKDANAAAVFLKSLDPTSDTAAFTYETATDRALRRGDVSRRGAMVYLDNCAACHRPDGRGYDGVFPQLAGNPSVSSTDPTSVISMVLQGSLTVRTGKTPAQFQMPSFAWRLTDQEVADVATFIRSSWGNQASGVAPSEVAPLRKAAMASDGITAPTTGKEVPREFMPKPREATFNAVSH